MKDIEDANPPLKGTLPQNNYASLGADKNAIKSLIDEINKLDESRFHEEDLIGRVYEYLFAKLRGIGIKGRWRILHARVLCKIDLGAY